MCYHLQKVLSPLASSGKLDLSTSGPSTADKSLLNANQDFWGTASVQRATGDRANTASEKKKIEIDSGCKLA